jgi:hypothetical protein
MLLVAAKRCRTGIASLLLYLGLSARIAKKGKVLHNHLRGLPPLHIFPILLSCHPLTILSSHDPMPPPIHPPTLSLSVQDGLEPDPDTRVDNDSPATATAMSSIGASTGRATRMLRLLGHRRGTGADIHAANANGRSPLALAVLSDHPLLVARLLQMQPQPQHNLMSSPPSTLLPPAAATGTAAAVGTATTLKEVLSRVDGRGYTPLLSAASRGSMHSTAVLLHAGADPAQVGADSFNQVGRAFSCL